MHTQRISIFRWGMFILLFLAGMNFINRYFYCIYFAFAALLIQKTDKRLQIGIDVVLLFVFAVSMLIFSDLYSGSLLGMPKPFVFLLCYLIGINTSDAVYSLRENKRSLMTLSYISAGGMLVHYFLNAYENRNFTANLIRDLNDFWTGEVLAATGQAAIAAIGIGICIAIVFQSERLRYRIISAICLVGVLMYNFMLGGRTIIVMMALEIIAAFFFQMFQRGQTNKKLKYILVFIVVAFAVYFAITYNIGGIWERFERTTFYLRFFSRRTNQTITGDGRLRFKQTYLKFFLEYLWGGNELREVAGGHYAHDLLLDTHNLGGIISFLSLAIYLIISSYRAVKVVLSKRIDMFTRTVVMCVYFSMFVIFFMEPILEGMPWLLASYCLISGALTNLYRNGKRLDKILRA